MSLLILVHVEKAAKVDAAKAAKVVAVAVAVAEATTKVHTGRRITKAAKAASTEARKAARTARAVVVVAAVAEMDVAAVETFKAIAIGVESMDIALLTVESILVEMQMSVLQTTRWSTTTTTTITTTPVVATTTTTTTTMEMAMEMAMGRFSLLAEWRAS